MLINECIQRRMLRHARVGLSSITVMGLLAHSVACGGTEDANGRGDAAAQEQFDPSVGLIFVPVRIGGRQAQFVLGSCTPRSVIDRSFSDLLTPMRSKRSDQAELVIRHEDLYRTPEQFVAFGDTVRTSSVVCGDLSALSAVFGKRIDGVLGTDFLRGHIVRIDFERGTCGLLKALPRNPGARLPMRDVSGATLVDVNVEGAGNVPFRVNVFHGGTQTGTLERTLADDLVRRRMANRIGKTNFTTADGTGKTFDYRIAKMTLGDFTHRNQVFVSGTANEISLGYLSRYTVIFDFPAKTLYLKPNSRFNEPTLNDLSGAHVYRPGPKTWVHSIDAGSPAATAGLKSDDVLRAIDGQTAESLTVLQIRKILCVAGEHTLKITRAGKPLMIQLSLKEPKDGSPAQPADVKARERIKARGAKERHRP